MLKDKFTSLCNRFSKNSKLILSLWDEIEKSYKQNSRHYHTLKHLENIYKELPKYDKVTEFSIFYHDIIYDVTKLDNEFQSAKICKQKLTLLGVKPIIIDEITQLINETKTLNPSSTRNALFLDADLSILGSETDKYINYTKQIRKEYSIFSQLDYCIGRKKVLMHFLEKEKIYHSTYFYNKYEAKARENITKELKFLKQL